MPHKRAKRSIREADTLKRGFNLPPSSSKDDTPRNASRILNSANTQARYRENGRRGNEDTGERRPKPSSAARKGESSRTAAAASAGAGGAVDNAKGKQKAELPKIEPHESLGQYNRRLAEHMRPAMGKALRTAQAIKTEEKNREWEAKQARIRKAQGKAPLDDAAEASGSGAGGDGGEGSGKGKGKRKRGEEEFQFENRPVVTLETTAPRRRLNDVAMAPPSLPKLKAAARGPEEGDWSGAGKKRKTDGAGAGSRIPLNAGQARLMEIERERVIKEYRDLKAKREGARVA